MILKKNYGQEKKKKKNNNKDEEIKLKKEDIDEDKSHIERLAELYLEKLAYKNDEIKIIEKIGRNKVDIIFGFKIPGIKLAFDKILNYVKQNIIEEYRKNEDELRYYSFEEVDIKEYIENYFKNLNDYNNSLFNLIKSEKDLGDILYQFVNKKKEEKEDKEDKNEEDKKEKKENEKKEETNEQKIEREKKKLLDKEINESLINDYCSYFLNNHIYQLINKKENGKEDNPLKINNFDRGIKYLTWMIELRDNLINQYLKNKNTKADYLVYFSSAINWIESYSEEIIYLEEIFLKFSEKIPDLLEQAKEIISSDKIEYEISNRNPEYNKFVNKVFFLSLDSILRVVISKIEIDNLPLDLINTSKEILQNGLYLESILLMRSKEILSLQQILKIIDILKLNNLDTFENSKKIIKYFNYEAIYIKNDTKDMLCLNLESFLKTIEDTREKLPSKENFDINKLLSWILLKEFNKIGHFKYREFILKKILENNDLIKYSSQIIRIIIGNAYILRDVSTIESNLKNIENNNDEELFDKLNVPQNSVLDEVIMNIFERIIAKYFELIPYSETEELEKSFPIYYNKNKINKTGIICNKSFTKFKKTLNILDSISKLNEGDLNYKNKNLLKLYSIVYVKIYLNYLSNFIVNNYNEMESIDDIMKAINNIENKEFEKVIKIYFLKLIYNLKNNNLDEFKKELEQKKINFYDELNKDEKNYVIELVHSSSENKVNSSTENNTEEKLPMIKYFNYTKYKSVKDLFSQLKNKKRYPLINYFVNGSPDVEDLEFLPDFNEFTNYIVNYYSFRITRDSAKTTKLEDAKIYKEINFNKKIGNFCKAWNHINSKAIKYRCWPKMIVKDKFSIKNKLINFLNDGEELYNGMYIAAAFQNFIKIQNAFLNSIIDSNTSEGILNDYMNTIKKKIPVQDVKNNQIILIKERFKKYEVFVDFNDVIYAFSERNIFGKDGKINYSGYNTFIYDYDAIEEELGKIILPGVCLFDSEDKLNFVTFLGEGFRNGDSFLIRKFYEKYPQIDLEENDKKNVIEYISYFDKIENSKGIIEIKFNFKNFLDSFELLLFYLTEKGAMKKEEKILSIINSAPGYLIISDDFKNFFSNEGKNLTINKIMNLWFFFEHLLFEYLEQTLQPEYKEKVPEDIKNLIIKNILNIENQNISTKSLAAATRRMISRYLTGKSLVINIGKDSELTFELVREEFWEEEIGKLEKLPEYVIEKMNRIKLTVGQAYEFYNIIGEEDRKAIKYLLN